MPDIIDYFVTDTGMFAIQTASREQLLEVIEWMKPRLYKRYRKGFDAARKQRGSSPHKAPLPRPRTVRIKRRAR